MGRPSKPWYWEERQGWYVTLKGKRRLLATGPKGKTKGAAEREFYLLRLAEGQAVETDRGKVTVRDLANLFLADLSRQVERGEREAETLAKYTRYLDSAEAAFGAIRAGELRPKDLLAWVDSKTWGVTVRHDALNIVKMCLKWAKRVGYVAENPVAELELPRPRRREAIPTEEQIARIAGAARGRPFRDVLTALRETGCRPCEVRTLTADRVDLEAGTWRVHNKTRTATGEATRTVYLTPTMIELTRRLIEKHPAGEVFRNSAGTKWGRVALSNRFLRIRRKLGLGPECAAYAFRHVYITDALMRGVDPATVAELVGHKSLTMIVRIYNQLRHRTDHLRAAARLARPGDVPSPPSPGQ